MGRCQRQKRESLQEYIHAFAAGLAKDDQLTRA